MPVTHYLVTDATPAEVEEKTGLRGHPTPFGTLVEKPKPFDMYGALAEIDRALHPDRCNCGAILAVMHRKGCPQYGRGIT